MNKLFNKIATGIVGIALAIGVGVAVGSKGSWATMVSAAEATYTGTFTTKPAGSTNTLNVKSPDNAIAWTVDSSTNLNGYQSAYAGVQVGAKNKNGSLTMTCNADWGSVAAATTFYEYTKIKYVYLWLNAGTATPSATVSIGGTAATSDGATVSKNTSASSYTDTSKVTYTPATGHDTGAISFTITTSSGAGYICAIQVVAEKSTVSTYTVRYQANGGSNPPTDGTTYTATEIESVTLADVESMSRTGYACDGWATSASGTKAYNLGATGVNLKSLADSQGVVTLYAHWYRNDFTVTYNANGGSNAPTDSTKYTATTIQSVNLKNVESMVKTNYACDGWATSASGTMAYNLGATGINLSSLANASGIVTLYAHWYLNAFTITYNANGGSNPPTDGKTYTATEIESVTLADVESMSRTGYTCDGWATSASGAKVYNLGASGINLKALANASGQVTLYAHWAINNYTITYNANGGIGSDFTQSANYNTTVTLSDNMNGQTRRFTKENYICDGWGDESHKDAITAQYPLSSSYKILDDITLFAHWKRVYNVSYVAGEHGSSSFVDSEIEPGSYTLLSFKSTGIIASSGYAFYKWSIGGTEYEEGETVTISGDTTVTALYVEVVVLSYDKNGGTGTNYTVNYSRGATATVDDNEFTAPSGKAFSNWNTNADGTGTSYSKDDTFTISTDVTLYAQWIPVLDITISNFTEISTNYDSYYTHTYTVATHNSTTTMDVEAHGVYKNSNGIQMNSGKGTYIKNVEALPTGAYITKIVCEWTATGRNSPTLYVAKDSVATTSSTSLGVGSNTELVQTFTITDALSYKYNYFYFDGTTVTGACYLKHLMICYDFNDELQSIAVNATQEQLTYTVGQAFNFSGSVTPTRLLSGVGDPTTSNLTFELNGTAITAGSYVLTKADNGKVLNVTYTESGVSKNANAPFALIVNYEAVTSVSLNHSSTTIGLEGEVDLHATVLSQYADPSVSWNVSSTTLVEDTNFEYVTDGQDFSLSMIDGNEEAGTIIVAVTATRYIDDEHTPDLKATCVITVAGAKSVSLSVDSLSGYAGSGNNHRGSITATANNFTSPTYTWEVVSETVSGMVTFSASTSATTYVNYVKAGTATIRCGAQEGGSGDYTYSDTITVAVASDSVSEVNWTTSNITCYSGTIFSTSTITSWSPTYTMSSGDTGSITSNYIVKLNGTEFTLGTALEAGTYTVTLTYGGVTTSINNPTLTVIQRLNTITDDDSGTYSWTAGSGDQTTIAAAGASGSFTLVGQSWTIDRDSTATTNLTDSCVQIGSNGNATNFSLTTNFGSNAIIDEVAVEASSYSAAHTIGCTVGGTTYVATQATASWKTVSEVKGTGSSKGNVVIKYTAGSGARAAYIKSITVKWHSSENIANSISHYNAQAAVVEFAQYMNTQMTATNVCDGDMSKLSTAWTNVSTKYNTLFGSGTSLNPTELAFAKKMLSSATAKWDETHDSDELYCLEKAMKTYEWCVSHYKETCNPFMSEVRPVKSIHISPYLNILGSNPNTAAIVIIVSVLSVAAVGGYFLLRKKKEQ